MTNAISAGTTFNNAPPSQVDQLRAADAQQTLGRQHAIATSLLNAGFPAKVTPGAFEAAHCSEVPIADESGALRPFAEIAKSGEPGLRALDAWLIANGMGGDDDLSVGKTSARLADRFNGQKVAAALRARGLGR
jgi:hypothetical protein